MLELLQSGKLFKNRKIKVGHNNEYNEIVAGSGWLFTFICNLCIRISSSRI